MTATNRELKIVPVDHEALRTFMPDMSVEDIASPETQRLIADMKSLLASQGEGGIGLAAPQVGEKLPIAIIHIAPPSHRKDIKPFEAVIINPSYEGVGDMDGCWEGCLTTGTGPESPVVEVPRYKTIRATWLDEHGMEHSKELSGLAAVAFQHETRHLEGVLIVDEFDPNAPDSIRTQKEHHAQRLQQAMAEQATTTQVSKG